MTRSVRPAVGRLLLLSTVIVASGCAMTFDARTLGVRTSVAAPPDSAPQGEQFRVSRKAVFLLWGIAPAAMPSLERTLAGQATSDAQIANLRVTTKSSFWDVFFTVLTVGVVVPRSVTFEGVVITPSSSP